LLANVLQRLGSERAWVVHAEDGLDEVSTMGPTRISELADGHVTTWTLRPEQYGFAAPSVDALRVGSAKASAKVIREVFEGKEGPARDIVLLNTAAALVVAGAADDVASGLEVAMHALDSGRAGEVLDALIHASGRLGPES